MGEELIISNIQSENIKNVIYDIRGQKVMIDRDLAEMYEVEVSQLKRQVRRNIDRFPKDFMFELTPEEVSSLRCQNGTLKTGRGQHSKYAPFAFTGKEKDTETGYHYFGARYYNSDLSLWLSVDPMADKYPSLSPYNYCAWNPMKLVDPNGDTCKFATKEDEAYVKQLI